MSGFRSTSSAAFVENTGDRRAEGAFVLERFPVVTRLHFFDTRIFFAGRRGIEIVSVDPCSNHHDDEP